MPETPDDRSSCDHAAIRRALVDARFLARGHGECRYAAGWVDLD